jgi:hypothetical protein
VRDDETNERNGMLLYELLDGLFAPLDLADFHRLQQTSGYRTAHGHKLDRLQT